MSKSVQRSRLMARFQPQVWAFNNAVDSGPEVEFDVTESVLRLSSDDVRDLIRNLGDHTPDLDFLAEETGIAADHGGPFYVRMDRHDLVEFLSDGGIENLDAMTDDDLKRMRADYGLSELLVMPNGRSFAPGKHGFIEGEIEIDFSNVIDLNLEGFLDLCSEEITGSGVLMEVSYEPVAVRDGMIVMKVSGDPSQVLECAAVDDDEDGPAAGM